MTKTKILILSSVWVEPKSSAAGSRMLQLIEAFQTQDCHISYASTSSKSEFAFDLSILGINSYSIELNNDSFDDFLLEINPNIVVFDRFIIEEQFGWRVAETLPNALRILDTEDLHCLRKTRELATKKNVAFQKEDLLKSTIAKREIASILRSDLSLIISTYELDLLTSTFKIDSNLLHYIPFLLDEINSKEIETLPNFNQREHFYFIGNFLHQPNLDTVLYLKKDIWPILSKKLPSASLFIYGAYPSQQVMQLHNKKERFIVKGKIDNANIAIQNAKICLAPIRFGAGIKGKFIEAMQNGTPSITTPIGAEAMHNNLEWSGIIATNTTEIINASEKLYTSENIWKKAQLNGVSIINKQYNKKAHTTLLLKKINDLIQHLDKHRDANFIGALLQHHSLNSSKYLSKWIACKNAK